MHTETKFGVLVLLLNICIHMVVKITFIKR